MTDPSPKMSIFPVTAFMFLAIWRMGKSNFPLKQIFVIFFSPHAAGRLGLYFESFDRDRNSNLKTKIADSRFPSLIIFFKFRVDNVQMSFGTTSRVSCFLYRSLDSLFLVDIANHQTPGGILLHVF